MNYRLTLLAFILGLIPSTVVSEELKVSRVIVYKADRQLHVCAGDSVLKRYRIALGRDPVGHKREEGDSRTPEGRYLLDWRNSGSKYHLSIHISYPNESDRKQAEERGVSPGGDIMIHGFPDGEFKTYWSRYWFLGRDWTDGCIAVANDAIEEIWRLVPDGTPIDILP